jgi:hypothetical protein
MRPLWARLGMAAGIGAFLLGVLSGPAGLPLLAAGALAALIASSMLWRGPVKKKVMRRLMRDPLPGEQPRMPYLGHVAMAACLGVFVGSIVWQMAGLGALAGAGLGAYLFFSGATSRRALRDLLIQRHRSRERDAELMAQRAVEQALSESAPPAARADIGDAVVRKLVQEAQAPLAHLESARGRIRDGELSARLGRILATTRKAMEDLTSRPERATHVHRLMTYYLPRAAELADTYGDLERRSGDHGARLGELAQVFAQMETAFLHYADKVLEADLVTLDAELRVLRQSLEQDLKTR